MDRSNPYETAFAGYLRQHQLDFLPIDESRRSELDATTVKSPDFMVMPGGKRRLLVDVKGRRFPGGTRQRPRRVWENWSTLDDVDGLIRWEANLHPHGIGLLVFVYQFQPGYTLPALTPDHFAWGDREYLVRAVPVEVYRTLMRQRSPRWRTVDLAGADYQEVVRPFRDFLTPSLTEDSWDPWELETV